MKFIQKDIDKRLLIFIILLIIILTSFIIYHGVAVNKLVNRYNKYEDIFGGLTADAVVEEFNKTSSIKETVKKYKEYMEKRYDEFDTVNNDLKNQIENLQAELRLVKSQLEYQKAKDIGPTEQFRLFQSKNEEISKLSKKIGELCEKIRLNNISDSYCFAISLT